MQTCHLFFVKPVTVFVLQKDQSEEDKFMTMLMSKSFLFDTAYRTMNIHI